MLEINNLSVSYDELQALNNVTIDVREESLTVLLGPNGAGKTTLLKTISGLNRPDSGKLKFRDENLDEFAPYKIVEMGVVHIPEGSRVFPEMSVRDNLLIGESMIDDYEENLQSIYDLFPVLEERKTQTAETLSGGEQQMLAIGRGLMLDPELLMLDEPSLGLAPSIVSDVFDVIEDLKQSEITILLVEQNAERALEIADYGYVLEKGEIVLEGEKAELQSKSDILQAYLGE